MLYRFIYDRIYRFIIIIIYYKWINIIGNELANIYFLVFIIEILRGSLFSKLPVFFFDLKSFFEPGPSDFRLGARALASGFFFLTWRILILTWTV